MPQVLNGRYAIDDVFADSGGMGVLYSARDLRCRENPVLVKTTRYDGGANAKHFRYTLDDAVRHVEKLRKIIEWEKKILVRFKNEAIGNLPSPNDFFRDRSLLLTPVHEGRLGKFELPEALLTSEPYLVLERIAGQPLSAALHTDAFRARLEERALRIAKEVLTILIKLHRSVKLGPGEGYFIYQDLKPANILVSPGDYVTLIDMGAVTLRLGGRTTEPTAGCITAGYAAPEAAGGNESRIDHRFDLYSLGVTLWEVFTRQDPQALGSEFPELPLAALRGLGLGQETAGVVTRALARDPQQRFPTAAAMRKAVITALLALRERRRQAGS